MSPVNVMLVLVLVPMVALVSFLVCPGTFLLPIFAVSVWLLSLQLNVVVLLVTYANIVSVDAAGTKYNWVLSLIVFPVMLLSAVTVTVWVYAAGSSVNVSELIPFGIVS